MVSQDRSGTDPQSADRVLALVNEGHYDAALRCCEEMLAANPDDARLHGAKGLALARTEQPDEALASYDRALDLDPGFVDALNNRAVVLRGLGRVDEALASYDRALDLDPEFWQAAINRANLLATLGRHAEAIASYDSALGIDPGQPVIRRYRGLFLLMLGRFEEALPEFDAVLEIHPDDADMLAGRGLCHQQSGRIADAIADYDGALTLQPDHVDALVRRGTTAMVLRQYDGALDYFDRALAARPDHTDAIYNRARTFHELNRHPDAISDLDRVLRRDPGNARAHLNQAMALLVTGNFDAGWKKYEWRFDLLPSRQRSRKFPRPQWRGTEDLSGKTVLLHTQQGLGDAIQFCRYAPMVAARGASVILEVPQALLSLMETVTGIDRVVARGTATEFDYHSPLMSLPLAFGTRLETIPAKIPYLRASDDRIEKWSRLLPQEGRKLVAICWAGSPTNVRDALRSIPLAALSPLFGLAGTQFVSVQKGASVDEIARLPADHGILHLGDRLEDFSDTAAVLSLADLVITVDTSVAHLAGALGRPVWMLLQFSPDWRWLLDRTDSPWYPTARLFRQPSDGDWNSVIGQVAGELRRHLH